MASVRALHCSLPSKVGSSFHRSNKAKLENAIVNVAMKQQHVLHQQHHRSLVTSNVTRRKKMPLKAKQKELFSEATTKTATASFASLDGEVRDNDCSMDAAISYETTWNEMLQLIVMDHRSRDCKQVSSTNVITAQPIRLAECFQEGKKPLADQQYDKILLLIKHGEDQSQSPDYYYHHGTMRKLQGQLEGYGEVQDPCLTGRGVGESLDIARTLAAAQCPTTSVTRMEPELIVCSPLRRTLQTAVTAFAQLSPLSVKNKRWVCHSNLIGSIGDTNVHHLSSRNIKELQSMFPPGIDYHLLNDDIVVCRSPPSLFESQKDLLRRTNDFLSWLRTQEETIIAISSQATWLQAFCGYTLGCKGGCEIFQNGEMRTIGIKF